MPRSDVQLAADAALADAVTAVARAYELQPDDATLVDFVVITEAVRYGEDPDEFEEFHGICFRDGVVRKSVGVGLLRIGEELLRSGGRVPPGEAQ